MLPYHLVSSREHSRALLLDDVPRGVLLNKGRVSAGWDDFLPEFQRRWVSGRAAGGQSREVAASARQSRLRSGALPAGWKLPPPLDTKIKRCVAMDLKENRRSIVRERLCLAARAVPAATFRESCGAVRKVG